MRQVMDPVGYSVPHTNCLNPILKWACITDHEEKMRESKRIRIVRPVGDP